MLPNSLIRQPGEILIFPVPAGEAHERESWRQQPAVGQVVYGRQQLLAGQVTRNAEHDDHARLGDPGDSAITRIAERVFHPSATWRAPLLLGSRCEPIVWSSWFQESANLRTPSSSSTATTSA